MKKFTYITYMLGEDRTRETYAKCMNKIEEMTPGFHHFVYPQEFKEEDFAAYKNVEYLGDNPKRQGFVIPKNKLLEAFYASDYDYCIWHDAPDVLSKPCWNDFLTVIDWLSKDETPIIPQVRCTMGTMCDSNRMFFKQQPDYRDNVHVLKTTSWNTGAELHFNIMANFKKHWGIELWADDRPKNYEGVMEDRVFSDLVMRTFGCMICPTVANSKAGGVKMSTWRNTEENLKTGKANYPHEPKGQPKLHMYVEDRVPDNAPKIVIPEHVVIPRVERFKEFLTDYVPRHKKKHEPQEGDLF